ncbi:MAG: sigma-70 family RNA polymerase sigma factor, partial [Clostridia bacterium]|nr:sigma-70 family RNA polymerase sigma factor [Clostridia bacterium]
AETVREREKAMYRVALLTLRRSADAEDAVAEAIEAAWRHLDRLREEDALPAYLMTCTVNASRKALRRQRHEQPVEDLSLYAPPVHPQLPVRAYLMGLPEKYRLPLALRYGEDMPVEEIARVLRLPRGTVSTHIARGLKLLRAQMEKEVEGRD